MLCSIVQGHSVWMRMRISLNFTRIGDFKLEMGEPFLNQQTVVSDQQKDL